MSERNVIRMYLTSLNRYLAPLSDEEAGEVVREIESHIFDVIDSQEMAGQEADVTRILARLGPPRELAAQYVSHVRSGTPPPEGLSAIATVRKGLSRTFYYSLALFGFGFGLALFALAFVNLLVPNGVAIWSSADGNTVVIGLMQHPINSEQPDKLRGFWITPVALIVGYIIMLTTHKVLGFIRQTKAEPHYV